MVTDSTELRSFSAHVVEVLKSAESPESLKEQTHVLVKELGFSDFDYSFIESESQIEFLMTTLPSSLTNTYKNAALSSQDISLEYLIHNTVPVFQSTLDNYVAQSPFGLKRNQNNQSIQHLVTSHDFMDSYSIPMALNNSRSKTSFSVLTRGAAPEEFQRHVKELILELDQLANHVNSLYVKKFSDAIWPEKNTPETVLTRRQLEVLDTLAKHAKTSQQVADRLNISVRTVNKHIEEAKESLGAFSTANAIYIAIEKGLISVFP